jgi:hypothetical protein
MASGLLDGSEDRQQVPGGPVDLLAPIYPVSFLGCAVRPQGTSQHGLGALVVSSIGLDGFASELVPGLK